MDRKSLREKFKCDISAIQAAPEAQRAAFEADFNKFLAAERGIQEIAMARTLVGENVYLKIGTEGTLNEVPAAEIEMRHQNEVEHFPGGLCERCIGIRADVAYPQAADDPEDRQGVGRQLDDAIGFVPMSPKPVIEPPSPPPIPARALRYGVAEPPLLEWPE